MGYTKEQREARELEREQLLRAEIEEKLRKEYEEKFKVSPNSNEKKDVNIIVKNSAKIPLDTIVPVICNVKGSLIYVSKKISGYTIKWDGFGSTEYMELSELVSMRNSDRRFFEDNWIVCEDTEEYTAMQIYDFLKVSKYYKNIFMPENIDTIFENEPSQIIKIISTLSRGMKETIAVRAKEKIDAKELDSKNKIEALETALNMVFTI